jgi:hypothetical protein
MCYKVIIELVLATLTNLFFNYIVTILIVIHEFILNEINSYS